MLEWCFYNESPKGGVGALAKSTATRGTGKPRRITVKIATAASERVIGRAAFILEAGVSQANSQLQPVSLNLNSNQPLYHNRNRETFDLLSEVVLEERTRSVSGHPRIFESKGRGGAVNCGGRGNVVRFLNMNR